MKSLHAYLLLLLTFCSAPLSAQDTATTTTTTVSDQVTTSFFDPDTMWKLSDLRPGMKGYGLTVFSGLRPEKFDAEVVGVAHGFFPGQDVVWCRLEHPVLKGIGVVAGMSGSPVYIDGKLLGAVAYGYNNTIEPLAGITPIENMIKVYEATPDSTDKITSDSQEIGSRLNIYEQYLEMFHTPGLQPLPVAQSATTFKVSSQGLPTEIRDKYDMPEATELTPLSTPIFVSGLGSNRSLEILRRNLPGCEIIPQGSAQAGLDKTANAENVPGGPVGDLNAFAAEISGGYGLAVPFVEGDAAMEGLGTVSWRHGNRLVAFGHPMFGSGVCKAPMAAARFLSVIKSSVRPSKMGNSVGQIGMVLQDRKPAIGGLFEGRAPFFDAKLNIDEPSYAGKRNFNYRMWSNRDYAPTILLSVFMEAVDTIAHTEGDSTIRFEYNLTFDDGTNLSVQNGFSSSELAMMTPISNIVESMGLILNNPWKCVLPTSATMAVKIESKLQQATVTDVTLNRHKYHPGDTVNLTIKMEPYRSKPIYQEVSFALPNDLPVGTYSLKIMDSTLRNNADLQRKPSLRTPRNYEQLIKMLRFQRAADCLYVTMQSKDTGVTIDGNEMPELPPSIRSGILAMSHDREVQPLQGNFIIDEIIKTNCEITGSYPLTLNVIKKD